MSNPREQFEKKIDSALSIENVANGPFAKAYTEQKKLWVDQQILAQVKDGKAPDVNVLNTTFDTKAWPTKELAGNIKEAAMAAYDGKVAESQKPVAVDTSAMMDKLVAGTSAGIMTGDIFGALKHTAATQGMTFLGSLPLVGGLLSAIGGFFNQLLTWVSSKISGDKSLSWSEAGAMVDDNSRKKRMAALAGVADVKQLNDMLKESTETPATGRAALDANKDGNIIAAELDANSDGMLKSDDKNKITQQINDPEAAKKLFDELKEKGVTFENQDVKQLSAQSTPVSVPAGNSPVR
ncbi:MAG: hypothetical protein ACK502_01805 [Alphaproteobacteria bacterium]